MTSQRLPPSLLGLLVAAITLSSFALGATLARSRSGVRTTTDPVAAFHRLFYDRQHSTWGNTRWRGVPIEKCPMDLVTYQEILWETKPDVLVEAGTLMGGSALFFASIMDMLGRGRVITIDIVDRGRPEHPRITYLQGASTDRRIVAAVKALVRPTDRVMVVLDSDHSAANVLEELRTYAPLVAVGQYLVVEDTNVNGHPVLPHFGPGPHEAITTFFEENRDFRRDATRERLLLTFNPGGYLKKIGSR